MEEINSYLIGHYLFWSAPALYLALQRCRRKAHVGRNTQEDPNPSELSGRFADVSPQPGRIPMEENKQLLDSKVNPLSISSRVHSTESMRSKKSNHILIHNVAHTDVILSLNSTDTSLPTDAIIGRPKFCYFSKLQGIYESMLQNEPEGFKVFAKEVFADLNQTTPIPRDESNSRFEYCSAIHRDIALGAKSGDSRLMYPAGFDLTDLNYTLEDLSILRIHKSAIYNSLSLSNDVLTKQAVVTRVYFPLLAVLIPRWLEDMSDLVDQEKRILLISGQGTPRDSNFSNQSNSTYFLALLMEKFINRCFPDITVKVVDSGESNLFRYDENIKFVKGTLTPLIEQLRDETVAAHNDKWKDHFKLTVAFADGSSARVNAVNAAIRQYRPRYMHFWQLKSFWHAGKLCQDDIESHSFEAIATVPPMSIKVPLSETSDSEYYINLMAIEMLKFKSSFDPDRDSDMKFWLRKSNKLVMAVLLVEKKDGTKHIYKGTNMEVSMPTGSLCAERNVIGSALSDDLSLKREDLKMIAVLSVPMQKTDISSPKARNKISLESSAPNAVQIDRNRVQPSRSMSSGTNEAFQCGKTPVTTPPRQVQEVDIIASPGSKMVRVYSGVRDNTPTPDRNPKSNDTSVISSGLPEYLELPPLALNLDSLDSMQPNRPQMARHPSTKYKTVAVAQDDMNPLKPCGACLEWLRKIAEVNPRFSVVTFANSDCNAVYVEEVETMIY